MNGKMHDREPEHFTIQGLDDETFATRELAEHERRVRFGIRALAHPIIRVFGRPRSGPPEPRDQAIGYLQTKIREGLAGFDVYDPAIFLVRGPVIARRVLEAFDDRLIFLDERDRIRDDERGFDGKQARYIVVEGELSALIADLGLDPENLPTIQTALASRRSPKML